MAHLTQLRRRIILAVTASAAALVTTVSLTFGVATAQARGIDWDAVGRAIGQPLQTEAGGVHTAEWLRTDLHVVNAGITENPGMELGAEAMFPRPRPAKPS